MTVPNPTLTQQVRELKVELQAITSRLEKGFSLDEVKLGGLTANADELKLSLRKLESAIEKLQEKHVETAAKFAALEAQTRALERVSDRHWQVWLALGGAVLALLVSLLKR